MTDLPFQGARLRLARTFHGATLAELGERVSVTRQYVQRLEADPTAFPTDELLAALAEVLHVEPAFFFQPLLGEVREEVCHFRKLKTTPMHVRRRALAYGTVFNLILSDLESRIEFPAVNLTQATARSREEVERAAESCRKQWGLHLDDPVDNMVRVFERAGGIVTAFEGVSHAIDAFSYIHSRPIAVRNTAKSSTSRARFDVGHELGHLVLHQGIESDDPSLEDQAHHFASALLLPRVAFLREFPRTSRLDWSGLLRLKIRWGVSLQAILRRAYDLGLLTAVQYRNGYITISRRGWKAKEPGEDAIPTESPEVVSSAFEVLQERGITPRDVARKLHVSPSFLEKFGISAPRAGEDAKRGKLMAFISVRRRGNHAGEH